MRCNCCGRFVSIDAWLAGKVKVRMVAPDSLCGIEEIDVTCERCATAIARRLEDLELS